MYKTKTRFHNIETASKKMGYYILKTNSWKIFEILWTFSILGYLKTNISQ